MKLSYLNFLMLLVLAALPASVTAQSVPKMTPVTAQIRPITVTNTTRIVPPGPRIPSPGQRRATPVQAAPTNNTVKTAPSPFLSDADDVMPISPAPARPKSTATLTPIRSAPRAATTRPSPPATNPSAVATPIPSAPRVATPVVAPKRPALAAPRARTKSTPQTATDALKEVNAALAVQQGNGEPRIHSLVPPEKDGPVEGGVLKLKNLPLVQLLEMYGDFTGRTVLKGAGVNDQLTVDIVSNPDNELTVSEAVQAFDIVLNQNQITVIPVGDKFLLALGAAQAVKEGLPFTDVDKDRMPEAPTLLTKIVQLQYAETKDVITVIQKFAKVAGGITAVDSTKTLIIQDYAINLKRMLELIERIDVAAPANEQIFELIPVLYAPVSEIADMLGNFTAKGSSFGSTRTTGSGRTSSRGNSTRGGTTTSTRNGSRTSANATGRTGSSSFRPLQNAAPQRVATPGSAASQFQQRLRSIVRTAQGDEEPEPLLGNASIGYYERSNSLLVRGTRDELEKVKNMVKELDVVQPQVLIEAIIMDVSLTDNREFGINILQQQTKVGGNITTAGGVNNGGGGFLSQFGSTTNSLGNAIGSLAGGFSYYGLLGQKWETVVRAMETDSFGTVLSRPQILTTHAEPAELFIGETLPFPSSSGADFTGVSRVSIQQVDIGISLSILPLINPDGLVILEVDQEIESFRGFETFGELRAPRTTRRTASAKIAVNTGETIILGGLISTTRDETDTGTPFLRKIPLLKYFFKQNSKNDLRSELILMLRPTVLATPEIAQASTEAAKLRLPGVRRAELQEKINDEIRLRKADEDEMKMIENSKRTKKDRWKLPIDLFDVGK